MKMFLKTHRACDGVNVDFLASANKLSGDPIVLSDGRIGIVNADTPQGQHGSANTSGFYRGVKALGAGTALTKGTPLFYDLTAGVYADEGDIQVGTVEENAADNEDSVLFGLNIHFPRVAAHVADASSGSAAEINALRDALVNAGFMAAE